MLGAGIVGVNAGELLAEAVLAIEAGSGRRGHRADDPRAPDAVGDRRLRGRDGRGHDHRPDAQAQAREGVSYRPPDPGVAPRFTGIRTFARAPHVASADGVDAAIVGVPFDTATSMRPGARFGPAGIRDASLLLRPWNTAQQVDVFSLSLADLGDLATTPGNALRTTEQIAEQLEPVICAPAPCRSCSAATTRSCSASCARTPPCTGRWRSCCSTPTRTRGRSTGASATSTARRSSGRWRRG